MRPEQAVVAAIFLSTSKNGAFALFVLLSFNLSCISNLIWMQSAHFPSLYIPHQIVEHLVHVLTTLCRRLYVLHAPLLGAKIKTMLSRNLYIFVNDTHQHLSLIDIIASKVSIRVKLGINRIRGVCVSCQKFELFCIADVFEHYLCS